MWGSKPLDGVIGHEAGNSEAGVLIKVALVGRITLHFVTLDSRLPAGFCNKKNDASVDARAENVRQASIEKLKCSRLLFRFFRV